MTIYLLHIQNVINASKHPHCSVVNLVKAIIVKSRAGFELMNYRKKNPDALTNCAITQLDDRILYGNNLRTQKGIHLPPPLLQVRVGIFKRYDRMGENHRLFPVQLPLITIRVETISNLM